MIRFLTCLAAASLTLATPALSQRQAARNAGAGTALEIGKAGAWGIFTSGEGRSKNCFIMAQPTERLPKGLTRDPAHLFVTMRQGEATKFEFSLITGYPLKVGAEAQMSVGNVSFAGIGKDKTVWLKNPAEENRFITELRKSGTLAVKGTSVRGNDTTDRFTLTGFSQALERAQKECS